MVHLIGDTQALGGASYLYWESPNAPNVNSAPIQKV
jgi:hypothetical protein